MKKYFRPSARLIGTIGEDIIRDMHAAVVELVKNAYDADANAVIISFEVTEDKRLLLSISDDGHGMTEKVVVDKWLVPSTSDKLRRRTSPKGRVMQGRKGIGRFAVAILGEKLELETIADNVKTSLVINWEDFSANRKLHEILEEINLDIENLKEEPKYDIRKINEKLKEWNDNELEYLTSKIFASDKTFVEITEEVGILALDTGINSKVDFVKLRKQLELWSEGEMEFFIDEYFNKNKYLDEILIDINSSTSNLENGTSFNIEGSREKLELWNDDEIEHLIKELRKLLTPIENIEKDDVQNQDEFKIFIYFKNVPFNLYHEEVIEIKPLPLLDYYDYRISGEIFADGSNSLIYQNKNSGVEEPASDFSYYLNDKQKFTGDIRIDFRIFDRDPEAIENLIYEMYSSGEEKLGKNEAKRLLNDIAGVSIFRNRFRIRPYGDEGNDWLLLDKKRVQNPAQKIGANQISGIIEIEDEEVSHLIEKSARDGLKEDMYYDGLKEIINQLLNYTELKRYSFRQKTGKGRKKHIFSRQIGTLTDFTAVKNKVLSVMDKANVSDEEVAEVNKFIDKDIEDKIKIAQELENQIAMYQGQATLGKIMDVVMHEVRKPLHWIKNQTNNLERAYVRYSKNNNERDLAKVMKIVKDTPEQLRIITALFNRLNSLATRKRGAMKVFSINEVVGTALEIFDDEIKKSNIQVTLDMSEEFLFNGWKEDILAALANIIENAIYWVQFSKGVKKIEVELVDRPNSIDIGIWNNGPMIIKDLLDGDSLFNPGISGKVTEEGVGTGLGLSIAGEAIDRNGGRVKVVNVLSGAKFVIELPKIEKEEE